MSFPSIKNVLSRLHVSYRKEMTRQLRMITSDEFRVELKDGMTLQDAFTALGKACYRRDLIVNFHRLVSEALGYSMILVRSKELIDLSTSCEEQIRLLNEYIKSSLYHHLIKESAHETQHDD